MEPDRHIACWRGAIGILTNGDPSAQCSWTRDLLVENGRAAGFEVPDSVANVLMDPSCDVFDLAESIMDYVNTRVDDSDDDSDSDDEDYMPIDLQWVEPLAVYLGATDWCLQYLLEIRDLKQTHSFLKISHLYMWAKTLRTRDKGAPWTDKQVSRFVAKHRVDVCDDSTYLMESDFSALATHMKTMTEVQVAMIRPLLEASLTKISCWELALFGERVFHTSERRQRCYDYLEAEWWNADAVRLGFQDMLYLRILEDMAKRVTLPEGTDVGQDPHDVYRRSKRDNGVPIPIKLAVRELLQIQNHALRRAFSTDCLTKMLSTVLKRAFETDCGGYRWEAPKVTYDIIERLWSQELEEHFFACYYSVNITEYLPFLRGRSVMGL